MKVLIIHFRSAPSKELQLQRAVIDPLDSAGTDGVSLEMVKRQAVLQNMGHEVVICSAYEWADFPLPSLEFDREGVIHMTKNLFGSKETSEANESFIKEDFQNFCSELKEQLHTVINKFSPDMLFVHNVFALPVHPVATVSLAELLRETQLPCAAIHHDILSEGAYKFTPTCDFAKSILEGYYPPKIPNIKHWTINTRNKKALAQKGVDAEIIHDSMDFEERLVPEEKERIRTLLRAKYDINPYDVVLFAGARIVPNKQMELAGYLTAALQDQQNSMINKKLYNGEIFSDNSRVVLVIAGRPERGFADYQKNVFKLFNELKITWKYIGDDVRPHRSEEDGLYALYPDMYAISDFVLYPTIWEGFGNQLLEAFAAELPAVVFEYPVFKEDIGPKGVKIISLGDKILPDKDSLDLVQINQEVLLQAVQEISGILLNPKEYRDITEHNRKIGKKYFSFDVLRDHLVGATHWAASYVS